jgi:glycosyltransferase 2 family protein
MKKALIRTAQAIFTIAILIYLFNSPEKRALMGAAFSRADPHWMLIGLPVAFVGEIANIIRWSILLRVQGMRIGWLRLSQLFFVGLFFNLFMPGYTGGDFARLFYSMREFPDRKKEAVLTIVMDRMIGMLALVLTAVITTILRWQWLQQTPQASFFAWVLIFMLIGFSALVGGSFLISGLKLANRLPRHFPFRERVIEASEAYHLFAQARASLAWAFVLSFPVLFSFYGAFYCASQAVHANVSLLDTFTIMPVVTSIISLPITPGGLGFRESLFEILMRDLAKVPGEVGILISLLGFSYFFLFGLIGGICYLFYSPRGRTGPSSRGGWKQMQGEVERASHNHENDGEAENAVNERERARASDNAWKGAA